jgi:methionine S-methyltransferase
MVAESLFQVYSDMEVAFIISEEEAIFKALSKTVEVLQGITAPMSQYYYGCLFHELLAFQLADRRPPAEVSVIALFLNLFITKCILC